jgi:hypothetical protein
MANNTPVVPLTAVPSVLLAVVLLYHWYAAVLPSVTVAATVRLPVMFPSVTVALAGWVVMVMTGVAGASLGSSFLHPVNTVAAITCI